MKFEQKLDVALKPIIEDNDFDSQKNLPPVKLDGKKQKAAEGAHNPNPATKHNEVKIDGVEFENREHKQSEQARPDLPKKSNVAKELDRPDKSL